jgi:Gpi18-like mannosyltransferase
VAGRGNETASPFRRKDTLLLAGGIVAGVAVRLLLLPTDGLRFDIDAFVQWVHSIAVNGLPNAYDEMLSFPPVIVYIWGLLAAVEPGFRTATDATDLSVRILMKLPPTLADFGLAGLIAYALRARPRWAVAGAVAILLHPAVFDVSSWWGQYESIYVLFALAAAVFAIDGRNGWAAAAIAVSVMTKPQALPMLVPLAAWFWATGGRRGLVRASAIGAAVILILWLPFIPADGPANYLRSVASYQGGRFAVLSLSGWNIWWLVQETAATGNFVADNVPILGSLTLRHVGFAITALLELVVALAVVRDPRPRTLIIALAASVLIAFSFLTEMHERYCYGAVVFLLLLIADPRFRWLNVVFGITFTLNLLAAVPPTAEIGGLLRISGLLGILGSVAMLAITGVIFVILTRRSGDVATP